MHGVLKSCSSLKLYKNQFRGQQLPRRGCICASGGFGKTKDKSPANSGKASGKKAGKTKRRRVKPSNPAAPPQPSPNSREQLTLQRLEDGGQSENDNNAFEERLAVLRKRGEASRSTSSPTTVQERRQAAPQQQGGILSAAEPSPRERAARGGSKPAAENDAPAVGLPQILVGGVSLALVAAFVATSGFGPGRSPEPQAVQGSSPSAEQRRELEGRSKELEERLKAAPDDVDALKELSDVAVVLGDLRKSSDLAERITQAEPSNSTAWLALAESRRKLNDNKGAAAAYDRSIGASGQPSLAQLQGLAAALVADRRPAEAVQRLQGFEGAAGRPGAVGPVELQLLVGKVYSQWDRHFASALAVYDGLVDKFPDDFRGYLARGALLKDNGRKGDAQRMFIKARFLAPQEARAIVDSVADR